MKYLSMTDLCGTFAENKDRAREIREQTIKNAIDSGDLPIVLDFANIDSSTQSFVHATLSEVFQKYGELALDYFEFHNCNDAVKSLIATVINYSLE